MSNRKTETKLAIEHAKSIYGEDRRYRRIKGTSPYLYKMKDCQSVCYGGKTFHIQMTLRPFSQSRRRLTKLKTK